MTWLMRKTISVFSHDSDPAFDAPLFFVSRYDADTRINSGCARYLSPSAVQLAAPPGWTPDNSTAIAGGSFRTAWHVQPSANYLVWQMRSQE